MSIETQLRDQLERATSDVLGGPDLATSLGRGRSRRRTRRLLVSGGGLVAGTALAGVVLVAALGGTSSDTDPEVAADPTSPPAAVAGGFVSGTDIDELFASVVARHLPDLGQPDDVYPSDWDHAGPMPDADHADATDWQAAYTVGPDDELLVIMGFPEPGEQTRPGVVAEGSYRSDADTFTFYSSYVADSGFTVNALETVTASSWQQAEAGRAFTSQDLLPLVKDPDLVFPFPASRR